MTPNVTLLDVGPRPEDFRVVAGACAPTTGTTTQGMHDLMTLDPRLLIRLSDNPDDVGHMKQARPSDPRGDCRGRLPGSFFLRPGMLGLWPATSAPS